jgi:hypothetical protein
MPEQVFDFTGVEGSKFVRVPPGWYKAKILEVKQGKSRNNNPKIDFKMAFTEGPYKGRNFVYTQTLIKSTLWSFRDMLEAMGLRVPAGKLKLDPLKLKGKTVGVFMEDGDEYEDKKGKLRINSQVSGFMPYSEVETSSARSDDEDDDLEDMIEDDEDLEDDDLEDEEDLEEEDDLEDEDEEETEDDEEEGYTEEELSEMERTELLKVAKEMGVPRKKGKRVTTYIKEILAAQDGEEEDEEPEEEPEPAPKRTRKASAKKGTTKKKAKTTEEELEDLDLDDIE